MRRSNLSSLEKRLSVSLWAPVTQQTGSRRELKGGVEALLRVSPAASITRAIRSGDRIDYFTSTHVRLNR
jgi:hypothetical protein